MRRDRGRTEQGLSRDRAGTKEGLSRALPPRWHTEVTGGSEAPFHTWPAPRPRAGPLLQLAGSSEPSTQSLSRSQTQTRGMQRLVMAHWNWLGAQVTSAAGGRRGVRKGSRAGRDQPTLAPKTSRGAGRCVGAPGITRVWCARQRGWSRAIKWPQKTPSYGGTGQRPPDPSAGQQAQPKSTSRDLRI